LAETVVVDTGFLVALLRRRDAHHEWAAVEGKARPPRWHTCEAVLTEGFHILGMPGGAGLSELVVTGMVVVSFNLTEHAASVFELMLKYRDRPMSLADACLVRMSEVLDHPMVLTTDSDFQVYRRHSRQVIPCRMPA
jgi:predicted nucleic acid-binding protein